MMCIIYVAGNLCTGVGGKKKKKMMYVTTKNAGKKACAKKCANCLVCLVIPLQCSFLFSHSHLFLSLTFCTLILSLFLPLRVWQTWDIALWGGGKGPTFQEKNSDFDWCPGCWAEETEEQAFTEGSTSLWHHHSMYVVRYIKEVH